MNNDQILNVQSLQTSLQRSVVIGRHM